MTRTNTSLQSGRLVMAMTALFALLFTATGNAHAAITSYTIQIDASSTQPISTGFFPSAAGDEVLVIAEGAIRPFSSSTWVEGGWIGADGQTRLNRGGQHVSDGMPYGAVMGGTGHISNFQFLGSHGGFQTQPADVGEEYSVALNMSDADLASSTGTATITLVHIPAGEAEIVEVILDSNESPVVGTGLISGPGDVYMVLAYGSAEVVATSTLNAGWFTPSGLMKLNRAGMPFSDGAYGGLYGSYNGGSSGFYIGEAGSFTAQIADEGNELSYRLNMSTTDVASMGGRILVRTIRIPGATTNIDGESGGFESALRTFPNPMIESTRIGFSLPAESPVRLRIYDTGGRWIRNLVEDSFAAGNHEVVWDGRNDNGQKVTSGTYFYQVSSETGSKTGRLVVAR